jgi:hypothetical protein
MSFLIASTPRKTPQIGSRAAKDASICGGFAAATVSLGAIQAGEQYPPEPLSLKYTFAGSLRMSAGAALVFAE